ncbi:amidohydrolase family protein [Pigmentiphaga soli]|uniref:Amidohydrolase family protein n=1 Tax=Pigmentiphaga soli TaxID=1007095 RepID=A0ABP8HNY5_9BURK
MHIVDAQVHIWEADSPERPWAKGMRPPQRAQPFSADDLAWEMDAAGVERAILIPPSWAGDYNGTVIAAARAYPGRFAAVGRFPVDHPDRAGLVAQWKAQGMLGLRLTFITDLEKALMSDPRSEDLWSAAQRHGVPVMLYPYAYLRELAGVAARHPDLRLVVDHMAAQRAKDAEAFANLPDLLALAQYPNVAVKASALPHYSTQSYPYPALHDPIRRVVDAFGVKRVFWGTDLTRLPCTYRQAVTLFTEELPFLSASDKEWVMGRGLCEWMGWPLGAAA